MNTDTRFSRRHFVRTAASVGAALSTHKMLSAAEAGRRKRFKIGLIGCGGRGCGAVRDALEAGKLWGYDVQVVALADYFHERALRAGKRFQCAGRTLLRRADQLPGPAGDRCRDRDDRRRAAVSTTAIWKRPSRPASTPSSRSLWRSIRPAVVA